MALNFSSVEMLSSFTAPSMAVPLISTAANWSIHQRKLRSVLARSALPSPAHLIADSKSGASSSNNNEQVTGATPRAQERDYTGTHYDPVYLMLPLGTINMEGQLVNPEDLINQLKILKSIKVDGVVVHCWWGIVEAHTPHQYNWSGYRNLFRIVRDLNLSLQVVMSFHACGGNTGDDLHIPLPQWVMEVGSKNPDIFFTDGERRRNHECLTWGIDDKRVLRGRTALKVYSDYMKSFRQEFDELFENGFFSKIEIGLGPCGELRYPSHNANHGWEYPGIGEFQCYDKYLMKSLKKAAVMVGKADWARAPNNAGTYNSKPTETMFFRGFVEGGEYERYYGRFFLKWYCDVLLNHADLVLLQAKRAFGDTCIAARLPVIHWWSETTSCAAELTAGIYTCGYRNGYVPIIQILKKHGAALHLSYAESQTMDQIERPPVLEDPVGDLVWEVLCTAWDLGITTIARDNAFPCYDRESYNDLLETVKPIKNPYGRHFSDFTYLRLSPKLMEENNFIEFERFVKRMHGESIM